MKRILLSAFGCAPHTGSDAEVAWKWATSLLEHGYDVWVVTRTMYKSAIESEVNSNEQLKRLKFVYYDQPNFLKWTTLFKWRNYIYYYIWQWGAYKKAIELHREVKFNVVHHVSWVSVRQPSFMGMLGIPFIFGPVAGGESAPFQLRFGYSYRQWLSDGLRDLANQMAKLDPLVRATYRRAEQIFVTSEQTKRLIPRQSRFKVKVQLAIGMDRNTVPEEPGTGSSAKQYPGSHPFRVLYVGRFIGWKGMHLGMRAFQQLKRSCPNSTLSMVGKGRDEAAWVKLAGKLGISESVKWTPWVKQDELRAIYESHDCFLFPSLHDSGGLVVLEAMRNGLPVVCLDLGGPGVVVDDSCGRVVKTAGCSRQEVVSALGNSLVCLAEDIALRNKLSAGATRRVDDFQWDRLVSAIYH